MKNLTVITLLFVATMNVAGTGISAENKSAKMQQLLIANPTARNIEILRFLIENKIFRVNTQNVHFLGIYHADQTYNFDESLRFIGDNSLDWITLRKFDGNLTLENLYQNNPCTPGFRDVFENSTGIFFFGGPDIQPEAYGEENLYSEVTDPARHSFELSLAFHLLGSSRNPAFRPFLEERPDYLVTGFCLGLQTMNVAAGGTLWQDIPAQVYRKFTPQETVSTDRENIHRNYWQLIEKDEQLMTINLHPVHFSAHDFFGRTIKTKKNLTPRIYSSHHQSPKDIGQGFEVTAWSPDGKIVEGLAHSIYPNVFAVQFHPEVPALYEDREKWKFEPSDTPATMHSIIGKKSVRFHKKYWKYISLVINNK